MGRVVALTLLAIALAPLQAAPHTRSASKKPAHPKSTLHVVSATRVPTHGTRGGRSRYAKAARVVHAAPAPTYQLHPDPDRYLQIQQTLAEKGYFKGEPNGAWGDDSSDAMRHFQADQKIDNDGKIDALSLIALGLGPKHDGVSAPLTAAPVPAATTQYSSPASKAGGQTR